MENIYLITSAVVPDQEKYEKTLKKLNLARSTSSPLKELNEHSKRKIHEWFDIHEKSFNEGGYLMYNHPMKYQINFNNDPASKLTGNYLYDWLKNQSGSGKQRLMVYKKEKQFPVTFFSGKF